MIIDVTLTQQKKRKRMTILIFWRFPVGVPEQRTAQVCISLNGLEFQYTQSETEFFLYVEQWLSITFFTCIYRK